MINPSYRFHPKTLEYLKGLFQKGVDITIANEIMYSISGIEEFFPTADCYLFFLDYLHRNQQAILEEERREYGDFQTPDVLTEKICMFLTENILPTILIEPTFGKGGFLLSALKHIKTLKYLIGAEIHENYVWHSKFRIIEYFIQNPNAHKPTIRLFHADIFNFDWKLHGDFTNRSESILILGNPPWVTNSELSSLNSLNIPRKSNFKKYKGYDAITGKGNFDIGEVVVLKMLNEFRTHTGSLFMLLKNSVIKNLVDFKKSGLSISNLKSYQIDAKKYFNASVDASLFVCNLGNKDSSHTCSTFDFSQPEILEKSFGWMGDKFVSDIQLYTKTGSKEYDNLCPLEWRQGNKHDNSKVFEFEFINNKLFNGFNEEIQIEEEKIYGIVKSSDLKGGIIHKTRKYVLITQRYIGENTTDLNKYCPKIYDYLDSKRDLLKNRKSTIYKNKPDFSIFGIGDYSFKPYKVAISGLYKRPSFSLIVPENNKPLMLDDTCYFLGFDSLYQAMFVWIILRDERTANLLKSISFQDTKRPYTKDILMRIGLYKLAVDIGYENILIKFRCVQDNNGLLAELGIDFPDQNEFLDFLSDITQRQLVLF